MGIKEPTQESPSVQKYIVSELSKMTETEDLIAKQQILEIETINLKFQDEVKKSNRKIKKEKVQSDDQITKDFKETKIAIELSYSSKSKANEDLLSKKKQTLSEVWTSSTIKTEIAMHKKRTKAYDNYILKRERTVQHYVHKLNEAELRDQTVCEEK